MACWRFQELWVTLNTSLTNYLKQRTRQLQPSLKLSVSSWLETLSLSSWPAMAFGTWWRAKRLSRLFTKQFTKMATSRPSRKSAPSTTYARVLKRWWMRVVQKTCTHVEVWGATTWQRSSLSWSKGCEWGVIDTAQKVWATDNKQDKQSKKRILLTGNWMELNFILNLKS